MSRITDLIAKRNVLIKDMETFLSDKTVLTSEEDAQYTQMENELAGINKTIDRLNAQDEVNAKLAQPTSDPIVDNIITSGAPKKDAKKEAFVNMLRGKVVDSMSIGTDSDGGYLCPDEFESTLVTGIDDESVVRNLCYKITTDSGDRKIPVVAGHASANWTDEAAAYTESDPTFGQVSLSAHKLTGFCKASEELVNDSAFDIEAFINKDLGRAFSQKEEAAFINGDGDDKPLGMLAATGGATVAVTTASASKITADELIDLVYALKAGYRKNASFILNDATAKEIRKLKDGNGQYIWERSLVAGEPDHLLGYPVHTCEFMPTIEGGAKVILFGDFYNGYWIADRKGISIQRLNELFAGTGQIGFKAYKRVDGKVVLPEAIQCLKMHA